MECIPCAWSLTELRSTYRSFKVTTFGQEFLQGASGAYSLFNFPRRGSTAAIEWDQSSQNFVVVGTE